MKPELEITYIFIRYITVTLQRQANTFYKKQLKIFSHESKELIEEEINKSVNNFEFSKMPIPDEEVIFHCQVKELLDSLQLLTKEEYFILIEKHVKRRSDADIGKDLHISGQMVSKKKRNAYTKLKNNFSSS